MFDAHLVARGLAEEDLETLHVFGVTSALVPMREFPGPTSVEVLKRAFADVLEVQLPRLARHGITGFAALGVPPGALPPKGLRALLLALPEFLAHPRAVAVGALGLGKAGPRELDALEQQLEIAVRFGRPVLASAPARGAHDEVRRLLVELKKANVSPRQVLLDGCDGKTVQAVRALGFNAGLSLHPDLLSAERAAKLVARLGPEQLVLGSRAGDGAADLLALPRCAHLMQKAGLSRAVVDRVTRGNAAALFKPGV